MKFLQRYGILCIALIISSCASMQPRMVEVQIPPERISQKGYSLVPLNEKGWLIAGRNAYQVTLVKRGESPDETFAIQVIPFKLPTFQTNEEFVRIIKEGQAKDSGSRRFKIEKHEVTSYPMNGAECVKSYMVTVDRAAVKRSGMSGDMVLEALTLICAHPKDKSVGIMIGYSQRYYSGQRDATFDEKATSILNSIEFADF